MKEEFEHERRFLLWENGVSYFNRELFNIFFKNIEDALKQIEDNGKNIRQGYMILNRGLELAGVLGLNFAFNPIGARLREESYKSKVNYIFTLKGEGTSSRPEINKNIEQITFDAYWQYVHKVLLKKRLEKNFNGYKLEFDKLKNRDLLLVEIEVKNKADLANIPEFGLDITDDITYSSYNLAEDVEKGV